MTDVTIEETVISVSVGDVEGPSGPQGEIGPSGPAGATQNVNTVAAFELAEFDANTQVVNILGYATVGDGGFQVRRVNVEPTHPFKYRSVDRYLANGTTHATNGGWWEIVISTRVSAMALGFATGSGNAANNNTVADNWQSYLEYLYGLDDDFRSPVVEFEPEIFYFNDVQHFKWLTRYQGTATGFAGGSGQTRFIIAPKKGAIVINRHNTLGTAVDDYEWEGADGSSIRGISFQQIETDNKPFIPWAFGIWAKGRAEITDCSFYNFGNHPIAVIGFSGDGGEFEGNANGMIVERCHINNSPAAAVYFYGSDVNAGYTSAIDVVHSPYAIRDDSFLGNSHYNHQHASFSFDAISNWNCAPRILKNGYIHIIRQDGTDDDDTLVAGAHINPPAGDGTHNTYWVCLDDGYDEDIDIATWGRVQDDDGLVYDAQPGQYANMWTTQPKTSATVWGTGSAPDPDINYIQWLQASQMVNKTGDWLNAPFNIGPYLQTGGYRAVGAWSLLVNPYLEGEYQFVCHVTSPSAEVIGGNLYYGPDTPARIRRRGNGSVVLPNGKVLIDGGLDDNQTYENGDVILDNVGQEDGYFGEQVTDDGLGSVVELTTVPLFFAQVAILKPGTVSQLPTASSYTGAFATVTDALKPTKGSEVVAGGAVWAIVQSDGDDWIVIHCPPLVTTFAALPAANSVANGAEAIITDSNTTTLGATAAGGGADRVRVNSNLTDWKVG
jgi:hypothetical protein